MWQRIAETARTLGYCAESLRRLEAKGIFIARRDRSGHRRFSEEDIERLKAILVPTSQSSVGGQ
jgi:DNA-binding transcriptional MerR regulator